MRNKAKKITYIIIIISVIAMISLIVAMVLNINRIYSEYRSQIIDIGSNNSSYEELVENYEEASSDFGKTVEELATESNKTNSVENKEEQVKTKKEEKVKEEKETKKEEKETKKEEIIIADPVFTNPVTGEIIKAFNKENLIYSETLKEWTTHTGIDIKAEITTVVQASANGKIKAIKNDPRYGITVIISHDNGFETRYSNLLTAEFVKEGEDVKQGQTIGTVGNTAAFEILDEPHLHFEILKNSEYLDPTQFIK